MSNGNPFANWLINNQYPDAPTPQPTAPEFGSTLPKDTTMPTYTQLGRLHESDVIPQNTTHVKIRVNDASGKKIGEAIRVPYPAGAASVRLVAEREEAENPNPPEQLEIIDIVNDLPTHASLTYNTRQLSVITTLTIHHTVSPPDRSIESIAAYHVDSNGWPGIGYHYVIKDDGRIFQTNYLETKSYHAGTTAAPGDENLISIGIALQGDFTNAPPPQAQQDAARDLVGYLSGYLPSVVETLGHRQMPGASTQCPGNTFEAWLPYVSGGLPPTPPPTGKTVDFTNYLMPSSGSIGQFLVFEKASGGTIDHQIQVQNDIVYVVKRAAVGTEYEELRIKDGMIQRRYDTSPADGIPYGLDDNTGDGWSNWMPVLMSEGESFVRSTTVTRYDINNNCAPLPGATVSVSYITFAKYHESYTLPGGVIKTAVCELHWTWFLGGEILEKYFVAPERWYIQWGNGDALHYLNEEPQGREPLPLTPIPCLA